MIGLKDVKLKGREPKELLINKHERYLRHYTEDESGTDQVLAEYLKMSGMYWGLNALYTMKTLDETSTEVPKALEFIRGCQTNDGGFSAAPNHDPHLLHTLSAVQMLVILDKCNDDFIDVERCVGYVKLLQQDDGSFCGDKWGEVDTRFSFCALATLKLLNRLDDIDINKAVDFVMSCNNQIDGGFGSKPGSESHSAYVYCCVGALAIANRLDLIDKDYLGWWLKERQLPSGGLNGRPEKLPDLCYSWWCLSSMKMIGRMDLIDCEKLLTFILACQDDEHGGFSDRPGNWTDPYHTMFGLTSLSLLCQHQLSVMGEKKELGIFSDIHDKDFQDLISKIGNLLKPINPVLCMPEEKLK